MVLADYFIPSNIKGLSKIVDNTLNCLFRKAEFPEFGVQRHCLNIRSRESEAASFTKRVCKKHFNSFRGALISNEMSSGGKEAVTNLIK